MCMHVTMASQAVNRACKGVTHGVVVILLRGHPTGEAVYQQVVRTPTTYQTSGFSRAVSTHIPATISKHQRLAHTHIRASRLSHLHSPNQMPGQPLGCGGTCSVCSVLADGFVGAEAERIAGGLVPIHTCAQATTGAQPPSRGCHNQNDHKPRSSLSPA